MISAPTTCASAICAARWACRLPPSPPPRTRKPAPRSSPACSTAPPRRPSCAVSTGRTSTWPLPPRTSPAQQILAFAAARRGPVGHRLLRHPRQDRNARRRRCARRGHAACAYHGGMEARTTGARSRPRFQREDGLIVVATVAFGMGIDKPDIRWVAHADLPKSIECLLPGDRPGRPRRRAGRDADALRPRRHPPAPRADRRGPGPGRPQGRRPRAAERASGPGRGDRLPPPRLLAYFGEASEPCGNCDLCDNPPEIFDGTDAVRKALSAMLRTGESFGAGHLIDILTGTATDKVRERGA